MHQIACTTDIAWPFAHNLAWCLPYQGAKELSAIRTHQVTAAHKESSQCYSCSYKLRFLGPKGEGS
eukprot:1160525-Pelagomonas_calceolata.AAC.5